MNSNALTSPFDAPAHADASQQLIQQRCKQHQQDEWMFKLLFVLSFPIFLVGVLATRTVGAGWLPGSSSSANKVAAWIHDAADTARSTIALVMMS